MPDICEYADRIEMLCDEYFHGELSPEDKSAMEEHIKNCGTCARIVENERQYFEGIKLAEYTPDINIAESVMNKIISERITVDRPAKKRFVPFGLITAAAIVLVMLINANLNNFENLDAMLLDDGAEDYAAENWDALAVTDRAFEPEIRAGGFMGELNDSGSHDDMWIVGIPAASPIPGGYDMAAEAADIVAFAEEEASEPMLAAAAPPVMMRIIPGEIIRIRQGASLNMFEYIIETEHGFFIPVDYRDILLEDLERYNIDYEIESTEIYSEFIEVIFVG